MKNRRDFLKQTTFACGGLFLAGAAFSTEACKTHQAAAAGTVTNPGTIVNAPLAVVDNQVKVPLKQFGLEFTKVVKPKGLDNSIIIVQKSNGKFAAYEALCPHAGGPIVQEGDHLNCPWHGSNFDENGKVIQGPAKSGLKEYPTSVDTENLIINVG